MNDVIFRQRATQAAIRSANVPVVQSFAQPGLNARADSMADLADVGSERFDFFVNNAGALTDAYQAIRRK